MDKKKIKAIFEQQMMLNASLAKGIEHQLSEDFPDVHQKINLYARQSSYKYTLAVISEMWRKIDELD